MALEPLSVLTWNIRFGSASTLDPLLARRPLPDVVTLQEVKIEAAEEIRSRLTDEGFNVVYSGRPTAGKPRYGNVIAARRPLAVLDVDDVEFPYAQLVAHARVQTRDGAVNVVTVHVPNGSGYGWKKIETLEALRRLVVTLEGEPLVLTGDFNEPRWEPLQDGEVVTWGQEWDGERWSVEVGDWTDKHGVTKEWGRWDAAVRWFFGPEASGVRHAFWECAGHGSMEQTHVARDRPRWFDHIFVSRHFDVAECAYLHAFRTDGHSDHSALEATLRLGAAGS